MTHAGRAQARRTPLAILCAVLAAVSASAVALGELGMLSFSSWLAALGLALLAAPGRPAREARATRWDGLVLGLLLLLAAFLRTHRLQEQPTGLWIDEIATAHNALELVAGGGFAPFGTTPLLAEGWVHTSNLYLYLCWLVLWTGGVSVGSIKAISILPGVLAVPSLYWLGRRFLPLPAAGLAAGLLAVSLWHLTLSRWGWDQVLLTTLGIWAALHLFDASSRGWPRSYLAAGMLLGLGLYTYAASVLLVLFGFALVALRALGAPRGAGRPLPGLAWLAAGTGLAALPLLVAALVDPAVISGRAREVSIVPRVLEGDLGLLWRNLRAYLLMFHFSGDTNPRHNLPGTPMLDPIAGLLMPIGMAISLWRWRRPESGLLMLWLSIGLLAGILSGDAPHAYRTGSVAPACFLLAGLGFRGLVDRFASRWRVPPSALIGVAIGLVSISGTLTYVRYFHERARCEPCWRSPGRNAVIAASLRGPIDAALDAGLGVVIDTSLARPPLLFETAVLLERRHPGANLRVGPLRDPAALESAVALVAAGAYRRLPPALARLPSRTLDDPFGRPLVVALVLDPTALERALGAPGPPASGR